MLSMLKEALEWLNRAEEAREIAGQLTDPGARKAVLELAGSFRNRRRSNRSATTPNAANTTDRVVRRKAQAPISGIMVMMTGDVPSSAESVVRLM